MFFSRSEKIPRRWSKYDKIEVSACLNSHTKWVKVSSERVLRFYKIIMNNSREKTKAMNKECYGNYVIYYESSPYFFASARLV